MCGGNVCIASRAGGGEWQARLALTSWKEVSITCPIGQGEVEPAKVNPLCTWLLYLFFVFLLFLGGGGVEGFSQQILLFWLRGTTIPLSLDLLYA